MIMMGYLVSFVFFLMELATLAAFSYWGFHNDGSLPTRIFLGIGSPLVIATIWGMFVSPRARIPVSVPMRILLQFTVFGTAMMVLYIAGQRKLAVVYSFVVLVEMVLTYATGIGIHKPDEYRHK